MVILSHEITFFIYLLNFCVLILLPIFLFMYDSSGVTMSLYQTANHAFFIVLIACCFIHVLTEGFNLFIL